MDRVLATLPSAMAGTSSDFDNSLVVRGGNSLENAYLIDGIELDNASHFSQVSKSGGTVGFVNSRLISGLDFYAGSLPASMPPRISSVVEAELRTGARQRKYEVDLNMSGLGIIAEGPIARSSSYLAGARFVDLRVLKVFLPPSGLFRYGDAVLKLVCSPTQRGVLRLVVIGAYDKYNEPANQQSYPFPTSHDQRLIQGGGILGWEHRGSTWKSEAALVFALRSERTRDDMLGFSGLLSTDTVISNQSEWNRNQRSVDSLVFPTDTMRLWSGDYGRARLNGLEDNRWSIGLKENFTFFPNEKDLINAGVSAHNRRFMVKRESSWHEYGYQYYFPDSADRAVVDGSTWQTVPFSVDSNIDIQQLGGYAEYVLQRGSLKVVAGVRGDYFSAMADYGISPRLGFRIDVPFVGSVSASAGLYHQFPTEVSGLIAEVVAADPNRGPLDHSLLTRARLQRNWQAVLGYDRQFPAEHFLSLEGYAKYYDREYPYVKPEQKRYYVYSSDGAGGWHLPDPVGRKIAYGAEVQFQKKKFDVLYYGATASILSIKNRYVNAKWYNDERNARGKVGVTVGTNFLKHHGLALRVDLNGGRPYCLVKYDEQRLSYVLDGGVAYYSRFLDPYVSTSLRYSFRVSRKWGNLFAYLEVWNALNQTPVVERYLDPARGYRDFRANGILPIAGLTVSF
jgi:hypothetical protein